MKFLLGLAVLPHILHGAFACGAHDSLDHEALYRRLAKRSTSEPKKTLIDNVRLFDGVGMTAPKTVVLDNGVITYLGPGTNREAEVKINGTGRFLLPGLIDSHCHISSPSLLDLMASYGVTTAVNMACGSYKFCSSLMKLNATASFITASQPAVGAGSAHAKLGNTPTNQTLSLGVNTTAWVEEFAFPPEAPSAFLKTVAEPGGPDTDLLTGVVTAAHQMGKQAVMHASYLASYEQAVDARPDGIQHIPVDQLMPASMVQKIKTQKQFITPTMAIFRVGANSVQLSQTLNQQFNWTTTEANTRAVHKAGIPLLAGTDATTFGSPLNFTIPFGISLHCELEFLVSAGLTPLEALQAATTRAARIQGFHDRGMILVGKRADVVLLNSNPLVNISNTRDIARVWTGGIEFTNITSNLHQQCSQLNTVPT